MPPDILTPYPIPPSLELLLKRILGRSRIIRQLFNIILILLKIYVLILSKKQKGKLARVYAVYFKIHHSHIS